MSGHGVVRIAYPDEARDEVLHELAASVSPRILESPKGTGELRRELAEYLASDRTVFDVPVDWSLTRGFARKTLRALMKVPFGERTTYGGLAERAGSPRAARAAGSMTPTRRMSSDREPLGRFGSQFPDRER